MIRITFKFDHISPFLKVCSGMLYVDDVDTTHSLPTTKLFRCKFKKESGCTGFTSVSKDEGIPSKLFNYIKPIIDAKLYSYWSGMTLQKDDYQWLPMEGDDSWASIAKVQQEVGGYIQKMIRDGTQKDKDQKLVDFKCPKKLKSPLKN